VTFVLGLTGSIGMGKSATAGLFREAGVPVHDADACVHALYAPGGAAVAPVAALFPGVVDGTGAIDRGRLRDAVIGDGAALARLEAAVHPLVRAAEADFLREVAEEPLAVLDVPLLYETGGEGRCDAVAVVTAPAEVQRARVLARPGMTEEAFAAILAKQVPDAEKRRRADFLVDTSRGFPAARARVDAIVGTILGGWRRPDRDRTVNPG
jgi:dephospho-CoA kinase